MALALNWSPAQWAEAFGYLANPRTDARLEIQVRPDRRVGFEAEYQQMTGIAPPAAGDLGYSVLRTTSDKQGDQMRVYFAPSGVIPQHLADIMKNASGGRRRVSRNNLVIPMLRGGFLLGNVDPDRVRRHINAAHTADFQRGFDAANP